MNKFINVHSWVSYPNVRIDSITQVFTLRATTYDKEYLRLRGLTLDDTFRYLPEEGIYISQDLRSYENYQLTIF